MVKVDAVMTAMAAMPREMVFMVVPSGEGAPVRPVPLGRGCGRRKRC
jgi:hypothetical protein